MVNAVRDPAAERAPVVTEAEVPAVVRRISWGAIIAGVIIAVITQVMMGLLGVAIGASTINPVTEYNPAEGFGTGTVVWLAATNLLSLFAGGYIAGRLAGSTNSVDGILHGLVTWGAGTIIVMYLVTTSVGTVLGNTFSVVLQGAGAATQAVASGITNADFPDLPPEVAAQVEATLEEQGVNLDALQTASLDTIQSEINALLEDANLAEDVETEAAQAQEETSDVAQAAQESPSAVDEELGEAFNVLVASGVDAIQDADREEFAALLAERTDLTEAEAESQVNEWIALYREAQVQFEMARTDAIQAAEAAAGNVADAVAAAAGVLFAVLFTGAAAAGIGGLVGSPEPDENVGFVI